ncbi:MAG: ROK family transcriptional regulator [Clostridiales bacterium]|nr:ROK family transcriptional regulator [Clostridiales bacterium]
MREQKTGKNLGDLKRSNRSAVLQIIYRSGGISRKEIAGQLGLTPATITGITNSMLAQKLLLEQKPSVPVKPSAGRREIMLVVNSKAFAAFGVSLDRTMLKISCTDLNRRELAQASFPVADMFGDSGKLLSCISDSIAKMRKDVPAIRRVHVLGVGVGLHGLVDTRRGRSLESYGLMDPGTELAKPLSQALELPVIVNNNVSAQALGELFFSRSSDSGNLLFVKYGPGIAASRLLRQSAYGEVSYDQAELGHMVVELNGKPCFCGGRGCLETVVGHNAILTRARQVNPDYNSMDQLLELCGQGDLQARKLLEESATYFAMGVKNSAEITQPDFVILYGRLFAQPLFYELFLDKLKRLHCRSAVRRSQFNQELDTAGPAATIFQRFFRYGGLRDAFQSALELPNNL